MRDLNELSVTDAVIEQMADTPDERLREVMASLVRHLHDFAREVHLTPEEWLKAIGFLTQVGQACTPTRQEFILLSDVLGLSALVNLMHDKTAIEQGTESSLLGPFYRQDAPDLALGDTIATKSPGSELLVYGRVTDRHGRALAKASVQVWQTDEDGVYDLQKGQGETMDMRGNFHCDAVGRFHFRTVSPSVTSSRWMGRSENSCIGNIGMGIARPISISSSVRRAIASSSPRSILPMTITSIRTRCSVSRMRSSPRRGTRIPMRR